MDISLQNQALSAATDSSTSGGGGSDNGYRDNNNNGSKGSISTEITLQRKEQEILLFLSQESQVQYHLSNPTTEVIAFNFPVTDLVKSSRTNYKVLSYSMTTAGYRSWLA